MAVWARVTPDEAACSSKVSPARSLCSPGPWPCPSGRTLRSTSSETLSRSTQGWSRRACLHTGPA
eukprot:9480383-Pyramimonas_sp.AAC.2